MFDSPVTQAEVIRMLLGADIWTYDPSDRTLAVDGENYVSSDDSLEQWYAYDPDEAAIAALKERQELANTYRTLQGF
jgi:hypothetical protein